MYVNANVNVDVIKSYSKLLVKRVLYPIFEFGIPLGDGSGLNRLPLPTQLSAIR